MIFHKYPKNFISYKLLSHSIKMIFFIPFKLYIIEYLFISLFNMYLKNKSY